MNDHDQPIDKRGFVLEVGDFLPNGAIVIDTHTREEWNRQPDGRNTWSVCLCLWTDSKWHPYVTWDVFSTSNGFSAESGHYYNTLEEAVEDFNTRSGRTFEVQS